MLDVFKSNLSRELVTRKLDMKAASEQAGLGSTYVRDVLVRNRDPSLSYAAKLARAHGLSIDNLLGIAPARRSGTDEPAIRVRGSVGAGAWHQVELPPEDSELDESPFPPDAHYPTRAQYDLIVQGNSINRFARDGERLRVVDIDAAGIDVFDDDLVIVLKSRDGGQLVETTAKRIRKRGPITELWPESDDPRWQEPERLDSRRTKDGEEGRIVALVLYSYNTARPRSRR